MDIKEFRQKPEGELRKMLKAQQEMVRDLRFKVASKQYKDVRDLRAARQVVARIFTVLKEKSMIAAFKPEPNKPTNGKEPKKTA